MDGYGAGLKFSFWILQDMYQYVIAVCAFFSILYVYNKGVLHGVWNEIFPVHCLLTLIHAVQKYYISNCNDQSGLLFSI